MCGIAGGFGRASFRYDDILVASALMRHRGPDDEGFALIQNTNDVRLFKGADSNHGSLQRLTQECLTHNPDGVMLHRRLSILDLSEAGFQPMLSPCGKYILTLNGEIYNYVELKQRLQSQSIACSTTTDTEVLLKACIAWGSNAFDHCVGMWSTALYDASSSTLTLCRDRFGIKPLYYLRKPGVLWYSSEIKPLLRLSGERAAVDRRACKEHILYGAHASGDTTVFEGVQQLLPGTMLQYDCRNDKVVISAFYDVQEHIALIDSSTLGEHEATIDILNESMRMHMRSDVPVGACLSGGLDSTTLVHLAGNHIPPGTVFPSFSAVYPGSDVSEEIPIREFLRMHPFIQPNFVTPTWQGLQADFGALLQHQELPFNSTSIYAQWEVMKSVSSAGIKVVLDGQGADEIAGGYYTYGGVFLLELLRSFRFFAFLKNAMLMLRNTSPSLAKHVAIAIAEHWNVRSIGKKSLGKRTHRYLNTDGRLLEIAGPPDRWGSDIVDHSLKNIQFGMQQLLRYEDRNSMAFSVEARVPYLDHRVVEYFLKLPSESKISEGYLKHVIRRAMSPFLPESVTWQKGKLGFVTPQGKWRKALAKDDLQRAAAGLLGTGIVNAAVLLEKAKAPVLSAAEESEFWRMYTLGRWHAAMIEGTS